jgi:hypothetical protein
MVSTLVSKLVNSRIMGSQGNREEAINLKYLTFRVEFKKLYKTHKIISSLLKIRLERTLVRLKNYRRGIAKR